MNSVQLHLSNIEMKMKLWKIETSLLKYRHLLERADLEIVITNDLKQQHAAVIKMCHMYATIYRHRDLNGDPSTLRLIAETNQKVNVVIALANNFNDKLHHTRQQINTFFPVLKSHFKLFQEYLGSVNDPENSKELENTPVPKMDWINDHEAPAVEALVHEWNEMDLMKKITEYLALLRTLVPACPAA